MEHTSRDMEDSGTERDLISGGPAQKIFQRRRMVVYVLETVL